MSTLKTAVVIDGGLLRVQLRSSLRKILLKSGQPLNRPDGTPKKLCDLITARDYAARISAFASSCIGDGETIYRVFYYDCPPFDVDTAATLHPHPMNARASIVTRRERDHQEKVLNTLRTTEFFAVRLGELSFDGWAPMPHALAEVIATNRKFRPPDFKPVLHQKGIDLKMGVDITLMAKERLVDRLVIVTADSDLVPAMKLARREGIQIILASMQANTKRLLREHVDIYRTVAL